MTNLGLLTAREVAERLGIPRRRVVRMATDGRLEPATKLEGVRGAYLFTVEAVEALERAS